MKLISPFLILAITGLLAYEAGHFSPWPGALWARFSYDFNAIAVSRALAKHVPPGITEQLDVHYDGDSDARMDIFYPSQITSRSGQLPTLIWVHGGNFTGGTKQEVANYLKIIASKGFTTIGIEYSSAPRSQYPKPVRQVLAALNYINNNALGLKVDRQKLFLAGESSGAQIVSQAALALINPAYASQLRLPVFIDKNQIRGILLFGGLFDVTRSGSPQLKNSFWSYFGIKNYLEDPRVYDFSILQKLSAGFPSLLIAAGHGDPVEPQSRELAVLSAQLGISVETLFFDSDYEPVPLANFELNLDSQAGEQTLLRIVDFINKKL